MFRIPRLGLATCALLLASSVAFANGTDTGPGTPIDAFPFNDTGLLDEISFNDDILNYGGVCTLPPSAYAGADVFYEFDGATDSTYNFTLTSDSPGNTDFALFVVTDFNDGSSCVANSQDEIDDLAPEVISGFTPAVNASHYLVVDAFSDAPGYPAYGSWSLNITCTGSCPEVTGPPPPPPPPAVPVPTTDVWSLLLLVMMLAGLGVFALGRMR